MSEESTNMAETLSNETSVEKPADEEPDVSHQSVTVCGYTFGEHASSGIPVHYLSIILKYFLPYDYIYDQSLKQTIESQFAENLLKLKFGLSAERTSTHVTGSKAEGLALPDYRSRETNITNTADDRLDIIAFTNVFKAEETIVQSLELDSADEPQSKNLKPSSGHVLVQQTLSGLPKNCTSVKLTDDFVDAFQVQNTQKLESILHETFLTFNKMCLRSSKTLQRLLVSLQIDASDVQTQELENSSASETSLIPAVTMTEWPEIATKWTTRTRATGWPSEQYIKQIKENGVHLLPVHDSADFKNVWIYSFFHAETTLAQLLSKDQRKCFIILKLIYEHYFHEPATFSQYHLKTFYLWICEFIPASDFRDTHLGCTLLTILETLCDVLRKRELDHYFIDGINLLGDLPPEKSLELTKRVRWVMENIIQCIVKIDDTISFGSVLDQREKLSIIFGSLIHSSIVSRMDDEQFVENVTESLSDLLRSYVDICKTTNSLEGTVARSLQWNVMTALFREILVDMRDFQEVPETMHNMDFMLGCLVSAKKDPNILSQIYMHLCIKANLTDKVKMISVLEGVRSRSDSIPSLRGKEFILAGMTTILEQTDVPESIDTSNQALYMQHYKEILLDEMLGNMSLS